MERTRGEGSRAKRGIGKTYQNKMKKLILIIILAAVFVFVGFILHVTKKQEVSKPIEIRTSVPVSPEYEVKPGQDKG